MRRLSDARSLVCPGCGAVVVLHAGAVRAHHFAHLPGVVCTRPQTEPETEEHRAGKLLIAAWMREKLPTAEVVVEGHLAETDQRVDVLGLMDGGKRRIALEYQCANLTGKEWRRRHNLYRSAGVEDLWLLGGTRLVKDAAKGAADRAVTLRTTDLERALLGDGAPLLFLGASGTAIEIGALIRFRPAPETQAMRPVGTLSAKPLAGLEFPFHLLNWPEAANPTAVAHLSSASISKSPAAGGKTSDWFLREWLAQRHRVTSATWASFFGLPVGKGVFQCEDALWQAALYYRFVHCRVGDSWWLSEVENWSRAFVPLVQPVQLGKLRSALSHYQEALAAAGFLALPTGFGRSNARIVGDLTTLPPPSQEEILKLARYRSTLVREARARYEARKTGP